MVVNATITLPAPPKEFTPKTLVFAGWRVGTPTSAEEHYYVLVEETGLLAAGASYKVEGNTSLTARYKVNNITIADAADNTNVLTKNNGLTVNSVTLTGRTLYKDGKWNTICLPFDLEIANTHLDGDGVDVRTLSSSSWSDEDKVLVLNFTEKGAVTLASRSRTSGTKSGRKL